MNLFPSKNSLVNFFFFEKIGFIKIILLCKDIPVESYFKHVLMKISVLKYLRFFLDNSENFLRKEELEGKYHITIKITK